MPADVDQKTIRSALAAIFGADNVYSEWSVRHRAEDDVYDRQSYAPRLDLSVGPFNVTRIRRDVDRMAIEQSAAHPFVQELEWRVMHQNEGGFYRNPNPRCLIAIELEYSTSSKHILGGITNASLLGRVGVIVASAASIDKVRRIHKYACRLREAEKAHDDMFANVACFDHQTFMALVRPEPRPD